MYKKKRKKKTVYIACTSSISVYTIHTIRTFIEKQQNKTTQNKKKNEEENYEINSIDVDENRIG